MSSNKNHEPSNLPLKLHRILEEAESNNETSIVSWIEGGRAFKVHDKERFTQEIMPRFFTTTNYQSFQRNCNIWGFRTASKGPNKGECSHPSFIRGNIDACRTMRVVRNKTYPESTSDGSGHSSAVGRVSQTNGVLLSDGNCNVSGKFSVEHSSNRLRSGIDLQRLSRMLSSVGHDASIVTTTNMTSSNSATLSNLAEVHCNQNAKLNQPLHQLSQLPQMVQPQQLLQALGAQLPSADPHTQTSAQQALLSLLANSIGITQHQTTQDRTQSQKTQSSSSENDSSDSNTNAKSGSDEEKSDSLLLKARVLRDEALRRGSRIMVCKARRMPMNHNSNTAFFEIPTEIANGEELVCSHPTCRHGGIKFVYCTYCDDAVAKRSFRLNHNHKDLNALPQWHTKKAESKRAKRKDETENRNIHPRKRKKVQESDSTASLEALADAAVGISRNAGCIHSQRADRHQRIHLNGGSSDTSSFSTSTENRPTDELGSNDSSMEEDQNEDGVVAALPNHDGIERDRLRAEWVDLLDARRAVGSADEMSAWLAKVFAVSEQRIAS